jgi:diaminopimelate decarboxylase
MTNENLLQAAQKFGTPIYVYDANKIKTQYQKLNSAFSLFPNKIFYACKALTNINILKYINSLGAGIDCSSINEVKLAIHAGVNPNDILYTSNGIAFEEIIEAVTLQVHVNIDSLSNLEKFAKKYGNSYAIGVRIRPNILAGGNLKISTGHEKSKFGIGLDQIDEIIKLIDNYGLVIKMLHIHTGSDIKDGEIFVKGLEVLSNIIDQFKHVQIIDLGGGFKVPYEPHHDETDVDAIAKHIHKFINNNEVYAKKQITYWFEPGKYLVSESGFLIAQVNVLKQSGGTNFAGVNSGLNHLIRPMFYDAYHHITNLSNPKGEEKIYTVTGYICETDTFATDRRLNEVKEGNYLVFHNAGAYGFEMASNYNSRFKPAEVLYIDNQLQLIRKGSNFEDLLQNQIINHN